MTVKRNREGGTKRRNRRTLGPSATSASASSADPIVCAVRAPAPHRHRPPSAGAAQRQRRSGARGHNRHNHTHTHTAADGSGRGRRARKRLEPIPEDAEVGVASPASSPTTATSYNSHPTDVMNYQSVATLVADVLELDPTRRPEGYERFLWCQKIKLLFEQEFPHSVVDTLAHKVFMLAEYIASPGRSSICPLVTPDVQQRVLAWADKTRAALPPGVVGVSRARHLQGLEERARAELKLAKVDDATEADVGALVVAKLKSLRV